MTGFWIALLMLLGNEVPALPAPGTLTVHGDLDGDGHSETVKVTFSLDKLGHRDPFRVSVGSSHYDGQCEGWKKEAAIVDVDSTDRWREIVIPQSGMDIESVLLIRFDGKNVELVGHVQDGHPVIDGSGTIRTRCRGRILCDWFYTCGYHWDDSAGVFVEVPLAFKPMKIAVTLKRELQVSPTPVDAPFSRHASLAAGTRATIDLTDDVHWCRIRALDGRTGWFYLQDYLKFSDGTDVQSVFDGLPLAD